MVKTIIKTDEIKSPICAHYGNMYIGLATACPKRKGK